MAFRPRHGGNLKPLRRHVPIGTQDSYLWAPFGAHMKAAIVSLVPILLVNLVAAAGFAPGEPSIVSRLSQGFASTAEFIVTFGWVGIAFAAAYCALWGGMSYGLVHLLNRRPSFYSHLAAHAAAGATALVVAAFGMLAVVRAGDFPGVALWDTPYFWVVIGGAVALGATGGAVGMWALRRSLRWHVTMVRPPLKNVLTFVEGKHDKDDFERM